MSERVVEGRAVMSGASQPAPPAAARPTRRAVPAPVSQVAAVAAILAVWSWLAATDQVSDSALAGSVESFARLAEVLGTSESWAAIGQTLTAWSISLAVALAVAVPLGLLLGRSMLAYRSSRFTIDFLRTIPALGLIPLAALVYGASREAVLIIVIPACIWPLLLQTIYGVRDTDPVAIETARSYGLGRWSILGRVVLPSALPYIATGIRLSAIIAMLVAISVELLVLVPGVGSLIAVAQRNGETVDVYAYTLLAGFLGLAVVLLFSRLERRVIAWHPSVRGHR
ncbi:ABC transporter permease [Nocardioides albus]|uniref:ABC-type nitrate/sulfonate/bicarbonate transport system permease component n=1 Tax=Nocardioides albus TaxID=1841 RepID=A0A7W5A5C7_9ACTN|nr:ABC transporter permease [Nocardioides albus]MBB3089715.1 ABC-type nitrate/sulfonate/bicarbonate transport system permease component [Nocardioides albus]